MYFFTIESLAISSFSVITPYEYLSIILSANIIKIPPEKNPMDGNIISLYPRLSHNSIAGFNNDQKLAAIITPAPNPSMQFNILLSTVLKKNTKAAPSAVIAHVNIVADNP